jgi:hypothetical protein
MKNVFLILTIIIISLTGCATQRIQRFPFEGGEIRAYIIFIEDEPLEWSDFKALPDEGISQGASIDITWTVTERMNVWWGYKYLEVHGIMFPDKSWVKPEYKTKKYLDYFRTYHKIAELYARKIYVFLDSNKVKTDELNKYVDIKNSFNSQYWDRIKQYENETNFGSDSTKLNYWIDKINKEFMNYPTNGSNKLSKFL